LAARPKTNLFPTIYDVKNHPGEDNDVMKF